MQASYFKANGARVRRLVAACCEIFDDQVYKTRRRIWKKLWSSKPWNG
jgi:hypothetical protein